MSAYTSVSNEIIDNKELTPTALGVFLWLLRQPSTKGLTVRGIQQEMGSIGEVAVTRALRQLEEHGYLVRQKVHRNGRYQTGEYVLHEHPGK